jgi:hypothetical protein
MVQEPRRWPIDNELSGAGGFTTVRWNPLTVQSILTPLVTTTLAGFLPDLGTKGGTCGPGVLPR